MSYQRELEQLENLSLAECLERLDKYYTYSDDFAYWNYQNELSKRIQKLQLIEGKAA